VFQSEEGTIKGFKELGANGWEYCGSFNDTIIVFKK
jgi:hypothetical protein